MHSSLSGCVCLCRIGYPSFFPLSCRFCPSITTPTVCRTPLFVFLSYNTIAFSLLPPHVRVGVAFNPRNLLLPLHFTPLFHTPLPPIRMTSLTLSHLFSSDLSYLTLSHLVSSRPTLPFLICYHLISSNLSLCLPLSSPPRCVPTPCFPSPPRRYRETTTLRLPLLQSICGLWECCYSSCAQVR